MATWAFTVAVHRRRVGQKARPAKKSKHPWVRHWMRPRRTRELLTRWCEGVSVFVTGRHLVGASPAAQPFGSLHESPTCACILPMAWLQLCCRTTTQTCVRRLPRLLCASCVRSLPLDCRVRQVAAASSSQTTGGGVEESKSAPPRPAAPSGASSLPKSAASSSAAAPKSVRKQSNFLLSKHIQEVCLHCATRGALCCLTCVWFA